MFGRPEWFRTRTITFRWPASFFGWLYLAGWGLAVGVPTWLFLGAHRAPEAAAWFVISMLGFLWDRRHSRAVVAREVATAAQSSARQNTDPPVVIQPEVIHVAPTAPTAPATESPFYISDAPPEIQFVAERTRKPSRIWMPWPRRFRV